MRSFRNRKKRHELVVQSVVGIPTKDRFGESMSGLDFLASRNVPVWTIILDHVAANKQHHDGTPMLSNNISKENVKRLVGS
jgi:hypothetical protein